MVKETEKKDTDPRHEARAAELAKQAEVAEALAAEGDRQAADAAKALRAQEYYEVHGVRIVEGKP